MAVDVLHSEQILALNNPSEDNLARERRATDIYNFLRAAEESFFRQRSRIKWLGEGDSNTPFYHQVTTLRNTINAVKQLIKPDGSYTTSLQKVHELALEYFEGILCTVRGCFCPDLPDFLDELVVQKCTDDDGVALVLPFTGDMIQ